jgi:hypothetical protein
MTVSFILNSAMRCGDTRNDSFLQAEQRPRFRYGQRRCCLTQPADAVEILLSKGPAPGVLARGRYISQRPCIIRPSKHER